MRKNDEINFAFNLIGKQRQPHRGIGRGRACRGGVSLAATPKLYKNEALRSKPVFHSFHFFVTLHLPLPRPREACCRRSMVEAGSGFLEFVLFLWSLFAARLAGCVSSNLKLLVARNDYLMVSRYWCWRRSRLHTYGITMVLQVRVAF